MSLSQVLVCVCVPSSLPCQRRQRQLPVQNSHSCDCTYEYTHIYIYIISFYFILYQDCEYYGAKETGFAWLCHWSILELPKAPHLTGPPR